MGDSEELVVEICPGGVLVFDDPDFPCAVPFLQGPFPVDGALQALVEFVPDEGMDVVLLGEAVHLAGAVLPDPLDGVGGYADVEGAVGLAGRM